MPSNEQATQCEESKLCVTFRSIQLRNCWFYVDKHFVKMFTFFYLYHLILIVSLFMAEIHSMFLHFVESVRSKFYCEFMSIFCVKMRLKLLLMANKNVLNFEKREKREKNDDLLSGTWNGIELSNKNEWIFCFIKMNCGARCPAKCWGQSKYQNVVKMSFSCRPSLGSSSLPHINGIVFRPKWMTRDNFLMATIKLPTKKKMKKWSNIKRNECEQENGTINITIEAKARDKHVR